VLAQVTGLKLDEATISEVAAALGTNRQPARLDRSRLNRRIRDLALEHAAELISDQAYLERVARLRDAEAVLDEPSQAGGTSETASAGPLKRASAASSSRCTVKVPQMKRTLPVPAPYFSSPFRPASTTLGSTHSPR